MWLHVVLAKQKICSSVEKKKIYSEKIKRFIVKKIIILALISISCNTQQFLTGRVVSAKQVVIGKDTVYRYVVKSKDTVSQVTSHYSGYAVDSTYTFRVKYDNSSDTSLTSKQNTTNIPRFPNNF